MSWLYSQALVEEYSEVTSSDGAQSAPLSGNHMQLAYLPPDRMTAFSRLSRFGMTFKPLTADRGEELLTLYLEDFLVRTFPQPDEALASKEPDRECGDTWRELLARYDPATFSWKTPQCSLLEDSIEFSGTWPRWGSMRDGVSYQQQTLVPHIKETESGSSLNISPPPNLANANSAYEQRNERSERAQTEHADPNSSSQLGDSNGLRQLQPEGSQQNERRWTGNSSWWKTEPDVGRVADGVAARVDRLKAIGNGQVPLVAATAWRLLNDPA
jgi:hypothetical protein